MKFILAILVAFFLQNCTSIQAGADKKMGDKFKEQKTEKIILDKSQLNIKKIKIAKADGTLQCNQGQKISLEEMQKQLVDIQVFSSTTGNDGMMRIQMCGAPTGQYNVYEILEGDLDKAVNLGFVVWKK